LELSNKKICAEFRVVEEEEGVGGGASRLSPPSPSLLSPIRVLAARGSLPRGQPDPILRVFLNVISDPVIKNLMHDFDNFSLSSERSLLPAKLT